MHSRTISVIRLSVGYYSRYWEIFNNESTFYSLVVHCVVLMNDSTPNLDTVLAALNLY